MSCYMKATSNLLLPILVITISISLFSIPSFADTSDWLLVERFDKQLKAAKQGKVSAMYDVAKFYEHGRGTDLNLTKAANWYQKAAEAGDASAKSRLGIMYFEGRGVKQNYPKALQLLNAAVKKNIPSAQHQLASMYELGTGVAQNIQKAIHWYTQAEKNGYYLAEGKLARLRGLPNNSGTINRSKSASASANTNRKPSTLMKTITNGLWFKRKKAVAYLPSNITNCVNNAYNSLHCISTSQERSTGSEIITYNTESHIKINNNKSFNITYANTVLNVTPIQAEDGDGNLIEHGPSRIKKGKQGKKRKLVCKSKSNKTISCSKGGRSFDLISR